MQQSATEKERGRSGQFNKRKYTSYTNVNYKMKLLKLQKPVVSKFCILIYSLVLNNFMR